MISDCIVESIKYGTSFNDCCARFSNSCKILFLTQGAIELELIDGRRAIHAHSLIFLNEREEYAIRALAAPYSGYVLDFNPVLLDQSILDPKLLSILKVRPPSFRNDIRLAAESDAIRQVFQSLKTEAESCQPYRNETIIMLTNSLLILLYRHHPDSFPFSAIAANESLYKVQVFLDENYLEKISITDLAKQFYLSPSFLSKRFKDFTGFSPKQYTMIRRVMYSRNLLLHTDAQISDIAFRSGFNDVNNYIKTYKSYFSETPSATRKRGQQK